MAWYKYDVYLKKSPGDAYDSEYSPGTAAPHAGIYRCGGCGQKIGIAQGHVLPSQNHMVHGPNQGAIRWRLIVYADHRADHEQK